MSKEIQLPRRQTGTVHKQPSNRFLRIVAPPLAVASLVGGACAPQGGETSTTLPTSSASTTTEVTLDTTIPVDTTPPVSVGGVTVTAPTETTGAPATTTTTGALETTTSSTMAEAPPIETIPEHIQESIANGYTGEFRYAYNDDPAKNGQPIPFGIYKDKPPYTLPGEIYTRVDLMGLILNSFERQLTYTDPATGQIVNFIGHYLNAHFGIASDGTPIRSDILVGTSSFPDDYSSAMTQVSFGTLYVNDGNRDPDSARKIDNASTEPTDAKLIERFTTGPDDKGEFGKQALFSLLINVDPDVWKRSNPPGNQPAVNQYLLGALPTYLLYESIRTGNPLNHTSPDAPHALNVITVIPFG